MTVCYFGYYRPFHSRNRNLILGLRRNGVNVIECNAVVPFIQGRYFCLLAKYFRYGTGADVIIVGFPGHTDVPLAWALAKIFHRKLVFDAFTSMYLNLVYDRQDVAQHSLVYWLVDWLSCLLSDKVLVDTSDNQQYFAKEFSVKVDKIACIPVCFDESIFKPQKAINGDSCIVGWHGTFLPLQGVETIIAAAQKLKNVNINFRLLGYGREKDMSVKLVKKKGLKNIYFFDRVNYQRLPDFISGCDIYLGGPFGQNLKANMVIPNKVVEAMAMGKPVICADTPAMRRAFVSGKEVLLTTQSNQLALARAIISLKESPKLRETLGHNALRAASFYTSKNIGRLLLQKIAQL